MRHISWADRGALISAPQFLWLLRLRDPSPSTPQWIPSGQACHGALPGLTLASVLTRPMGCAVAPRAVGRGAWADVTFAEAIRSNRRKRRQGTEEWQRGDLVPATGDAHPLVSGIAARRASCSSLKAASEPLVNTASRARAVAAAGQILVTPTVYDSVRSDLPGSEAHQYMLKGFTEAIELFVA